VPILFEQIASQCRTDNESSPTAGDGKIWLVIDQSTLGIPRATASRYWTFARAWLINAIDGKNE
jgi:hypothetical protein